MCLQKLKEEIPNLNQDSNVLSKKMQNFFEFLKNNEKTKHSISKESFEISENPAFLTNYSLLDFKKVRDAAKKSKNDIANSPLKCHESLSLNISTISKNSSPQVSSFIEDKEKLMEENRKLLDEIQNYKILIKSKCDEVKNLNDLSLHQQEEMQNFNEKINDYELVSKKNEVYLEYLKDKEHKILSLESKLGKLQRELLASEKHRALLHSQIQELKGNLRIFCRLKPTDPSTQIVSVGECSNSTVLELKNPNNSKTSYYFDHVFDTNSNQKQIFDEILPFIQSAIDGEQVSILAYGQTGSGKTFTLEGNGLYDGEEGFNERLKGIMPRAVEFIFNEKKRLEILGKTMRFLLSIIEIYNENLTDLLCPENKPSINQIGSKVCLKSLASIEIIDGRQLVGLIRKASKSRVTDKTQFNERSSRSHCIYRITISISSEKEKEGVLNIVDLAGSERSSTQFIDELAHEKDKEKVKKIQNEANFINKSLTTMGRIVRLISEKQPVSNIPYRESKLTRILQVFLIIF